MVMSYLLVAFCFCVNFASGSDISKSFRKDHYYSNAKYPERWCDYPTEGGRVHYVYSGEKGLELTPPYTVTLGTSVIVLDEETSLTPFEGLDWVRASYNDVTGDVFVSFHAHTNSFLTGVDRLVVTDSAAEQHVLVDTSDDVHIDPTDESAEATVQVSFVTSRADFKELVVHLHNYGTEMETVTELVVNGVAVAVSVDDAGLVLAPGGHSVKVVSVVEQKLAEASTWTVAIATGEGKYQRVGYGGRLVKELFPMESWPKSDQCPFDVPGANATNFDALYTEQHLDTYYFSGACDAEDTDVFSAAAASQASEKPWFVLASEKFSDDPDDKIAPSAFPGVAALSIGDEADSGLDAAEEHWQRQMLRELLYPTLSTYMGGHSNHLNGAFAGMSDVQGMDFYIAACAPHITGAVHPMSIWGAFDYLRVSRDNHRPQTTWGYTQAYCATCWPIQAHGNEIVMQMAAVVAAGAKGMMLFQSDVVARGTEAWDLGGRFLASVDAVRSFLRVADVEGASVSLPPQELYGPNRSLVEVLRSPEELLVVAVNQHAYNYSDVLCYLRELTPHDHWAFEEHTIDYITVDLPEDLLAGREGDVADMFEAVEVRDGEFVTDMNGVHWTLDSGARQWKLASVKLDGTENVARMFMLRSKA